jgi:MFS family permease
MIYLQTGLTFSWMPPFLTGPEVADATARLADALKFSAIISFAYAAFCFTLPHTPPKRDATQPLAFAKAFGMFRERSFAVLVLVSLPISVIHQVYFLQTGPFLSSLGVLDSQIGPAMTIGQFSEILIMAGLGWMLAKFGFRSVITIGALAYFVRYMIWSMPELPLSVIVGSQFLHGICYACFFAASFIYVDRIAPPDIRHSAQTVFGILILGGGPVLGGMLSGYLQALYTTVEVVDFGALWRVIALIGLASAVVFVALFRVRPENAAAPPTPTG